MLRKPLLGKTIIFAVTKRHAATLAKMFDDAFADRKDSPEVPKTLTRLLGNNKVVAQPTMLPLHIPTIISTLAGLFAKSPATIIVWDVRASFAMDAPFDFAQDRLRASAHPMMLVSNQEAFEREE